MIRSIQPSDAEALVEICRAALGHEVSAAQLRRRIPALAEDETYFIAVFEGENHRAIGFIQAQRYRLLYGDDGWNIIALAVEPARQGRGVGRALLTALEEYARDRGDAFVRLNSNVVRAGAHAFYARMGYACDKAQKRFIKTLT
ncbi:MAG: GNAT family N-acetyltransferase [Clostridia bacterium]|nr:GNAT family N-acetyltransferase [Clostridia bacterium]